MAKFCNQCGTKNEDGAGFCENCGSPLRKPGTPAPSAEQSKPASNAATPSADANPAGAAADPGDRLKALASSKTTIYAAGTLVGVLLLGSAATYFMRIPPSATSAKLTAAAKDGYSPGQLVQYRRELCLSNLNYGLNEFNVAENNQSTLTWLNALVSAGLYSAAVPVSSGGYFPQTLMQYVPTPELAKWRQDSQLCLAKDIEITDVIDIEKPQEEALGSGAGAKKLLTVKAKLLLQAGNAAPWLDKADVLEAVAPRIEGWEYKSAKLQKQVPDMFGLKDGKWTTGPAYKSELQKQLRDSQRRDNVNHRNEEASQKSFFSSLSSSLSGFFSFGGHPLKGSWHLDTKGMGLGVGSDYLKAAGIDVRINFTSDAMETGGSSIKCKFEVDGDRVKVKPEGQAASLIFVMDGKDSASLDMGLMTMHYTRVN